MAKKESHMSLKQIWIMVKDTFASWLDDYAPSMGAALAYYTMFSIAPLLLIVISTAGLIFGEEAVRGEIFDQFRGLMGDQGAQAIQTLLASVSQSEAGAAGTVIGAVLVVIGATTVLGELQDAFDRIWRVPSKEKKGSSIWRWIRTRLLSIGIILGIGFLLIVSLIFSAAMAALGKWWAPRFSDLEVLATAINFIVSFALLSAVFAMLYKLMPRVEIGWGDVWAGAIVTALLFSVGKLLIGLYIGKSAIGSGFGAAGSLVVLLVWVYYSAQIVLLGAEFTRVYSQTRGSRKGLLAFEEGTETLPTKSHMTAAGDAMSGSTSWPGK